MTCPECGVEVAQDARLCPACGAIVATATIAAGDVPVGGPAGTAGAVQPAPDRAGEYRRQATEGLRDARSVLPRLIADPVGQLAPVAHELGRERALWVGLAFVAVFDLAVLIGTWLLMRGSLSMGFFSMSLASLLGLDGVSGAIKLLIIGLIPAASLVAATAAARTSMRQPGLGVGGDVFIAGAALLPFAPFLLLAGVFGLSVFEIIGALLVIALCLNVMLLFRGCTHVAGLSERAASLGVPLMLLLSLWLSSVLLRAMS